jgi:hypothetical protein
VSDKGIRARQGEAVFSSRLQRDPRDLCLEGVEAH